LLAFPDVQDLSCAAVGPDALLILTAVDNLGIFAVAKLCAVAAVLANVAVTFAVRVSHFSGVLAVASVQYLLLWCPLLLLASLLLLTFHFWWLLQPCWCWRPSCSSSSSLLYFCQPCYSFCYFFLLLTSSSAFAAALTFFVFVPRASGVSKVARLLHPIDDVPSANGLSKVTGVPANAGVPVFFCYPAVDVSAVAGFPSLLLTSPFRQF
jgi:hypothetical protein